jgi:radical SAM protein with 4Fe4S-binding SPASM domain
VDPKSLFVEPIVISPDLASNRRSPFVLVPQFFGSTVFDRQTSKYLPFDEDATRLLRRLQFDSFDKVHAEQQDLEQREALERFFEDFYRLGFFSIDGRFIGSVFDVVTPDDHLVGPLAVHLEVVASCNLTCTHCFAGELPRKEAALTLRELDALFQTLAGMGSYRLGLTGGEPLLRHDIFDIIDAAVDHGLHPCLTTNGLLITEAIARKFAERELVWLNVSLEGATSLTNDTVRGQGTFDRVMDRLAILTEHARFTLAFTIMQSNLAEIEACAELARRVGAHSAVFRPLYPVGTAQHHLHLMPTFGQYNDALNRLAGLQHGAGFELCSLEPFSPQSRSESQAITNETYGCGAGNHVCSISLSGNVNPCSFLGPGFVAANVRTRPFADIWHNSQTFAAMRTRQIGQEDEFRGGCRARALVFNGSAHAADPWITDYDNWSSGTEHVHHPLSILRLSK